MPTLSDVYINRTASFLPNDPVDNDHMESVLGMVNELPSRTRKMILRSNAIKTRHYAIDPLTRKTTHSNAELAANAVRILFNDGINPQDIGSFAVGTSYPDQILPGQGVMVHGLLPELPVCEVMTTAGVCVAGMTAMKYAFHAVKTGEQANAIAVASETASAIMRSEHFTSEIDAQQLANAKPEIGFEKDFLRWMLSDGAGAVHLSNAPLSGRLNLKIQWIDLFSYANEMPVCMYAGGDKQPDGSWLSWKSVSPEQRDNDGLMNVKQEVKLLNDNIIHYTIEKPLQTLIDKYGLTADSIDWFLPHYSSGYFRDKVLAGLTVAGLPISQDKWFTNLATKGNTGSASIYIMLDEFIRTQAIKHGDTILCYIPESGRFSTCFMLLEAIDER